MRICSVAGLRRQRSQRSGRIGRRGFVLYNQVMAMLSSA
jgi:hypothetical protein